MSFKEIKPEELQKNPFQMIGKEWLLVTAEKDGKANTMTASWGGVGVMWGRNVAFIVIRPQRYTKEFIDASDKLSLSVLDEEYRKTLSYLGSVSGRDEDKIAKSGLTVAHTDDVPYFAEANTVITCFYYPHLQSNKKDFRQIISSFFYFVFPARRCRLCSVPTAYHTLPGKRSTAGRHSAKAGSTADSSPSFCGFIFAKKSLTFGEIL